MFNILVYIILALVPYEPHWVTPEEYAVQQKSEEVQHVAKIFNLVFKFVIKNPINNGAK